VITGGESKAFPTVLVGTPKEDLRVSLALELDPARRHVIEADSQHGVLDLVRLHSRPIQVLLLDVMLDNNGFAASLKKYRPDMQVILMTEGFGENSRGAVTPEVALARAQDLLGGSRKVHTARLPTAG
jgi:hypothetical protein